jgi:hypothetical protein
MGKPRMGRHFSLRLEQCRPCRGCVCYVLHRSTGSRPWLINFAAARLSLTRAFAYRNLLNRAPWPTAKPGHAIGLQLRVACPASRLGAWRPLPSSLSPLPSSLFPFHPESIRPLAFGETTHTTTVPSVAVFFENSSDSRRVMGPISPLPMVRPSTWVTGASSPIVPVQNISSAR